MFSSATSAFLTGKCGALKPLRKQRYRKPILLALSIWMLSLVVASANSFAQPDGPVPAASNQVAAPVSPPAAPPATSANDAVDAGAAPEQVTSRCALRELASYLRAFLAGEHKNRGTRDRLVTMIHKYPEIT